MRLLIAFVVTLLVVASASAEKRLALVIGNDEYRNLPKLERAVGDARAVTAALERLGFTVTFAENVGLAEFATTIANFGAAIRPGDEVVLHYSGHGVAINGRNYLIPVDMPKPEQASLVTRLAFDAGTLVAELGDQGPKLVFAILDACRDNPFASLGRSIGTSRGLSRMEPKAGQFILFSAGPGEQALDRLGEGDTATTSVFTRVFLEHLETPGLTLQDLAKATQGEVRELAATVGSVQFPDYFDRTEGKPVLAAASALPEPVVAPPESASSEAEVVFWQSAETSGQGADFQAYLDTFPNGTFAPLAKSRIAALARAEAQEVIAQPDTSPVTSSTGVSDQNPSAMPATVATLEPTISATVPSREVLLFTLNQTDRVWTMALSLDGARIATGGADGTTNVWEAASGKLIKTFKGHVERIAFSPNGDRISVVGKKEATIWDVETGRVIATLEGHTRLVWSAEFSPDGTRIATASNDHTAKVWDASTGRLVKTLKGHAGIVYSAVFSSDGRQILTASEDHTAKLWNAETGEALITLTGHDANVHSAVFSPDGKRILTRSDTAKVWDSRSGLLIRTVQSADAAFSPDGSLLAAWGYTRIVRTPAGVQIWDGVSGSSINTLGDSGVGTSEAIFSPDGRRLVTIEPENVIRIWDIASGTVLATLTGSKAALSNDGTRLVTGGDSNDVRVWDVSGLFAVGIVQHN